MLGKASLVARWDAGGSLQSAYRPQWAGQPNGLIRPRAAFHDHNPKDDTSLNFACLHPTNPTAGPKCHAPPQLSESLSQFPFSPILFDTFSDYYSRHFKKTYSELYNYYGIVKIIFPPIILKAEYFRYHAVPTWPVLPLRQRAAEEARLPALTFKTMIGLAVGKRHKQDMSTSLWTMLQSCKKDHEMQGFAALVGLLFFPKFLTL